MVSKSKVQNQSSCEFSTQHNSTEKKEYRGQHDSGERSSEPLENWLVEGNAFKKN